MPDAAAETRVVVEVAGRRLSLSNLEKVLYPGSGTTKGEVIDYYTRVSPALLPHLQGRPLTLRRWPNGTGTAGFFEKNAARHAPDWIRTAVIETPGSTKDRETIEFVIVEDLPSLVYVATMAGLELHVPQWRVDDEARPLFPDRLVVDLDPGAPADVVDCCRVAVLVRDLLGGDGLPAHPKTSGNKGLQLYAGLDATASGEDVNGYARAMAQRLERAHPELVVSRMEKRLRPGKVLVDWSQNNAAKTTIAPYSLRGREIPTVSTPVTWAEVEETAGGARGRPGALTYRFDEVLDRVARHGDLLAPLLDEAAPLPA